MSHRCIGHLAKTLAMIGVLIMATGCPSVPQDRHRIGAAHLQYSDLPVLVRDSWQQHYSEYSVIAVEKVVETGRSETYSIVGSRTLDQRVIVTYDAEGRRLDVKVESTGATPNAP